MDNVRRQLTFLIVCGLMAFAGNSPTTQAANINSPAAFLEYVVTTSIRDLTDRGASDAERTDRFRKIIHETFAIELAGKWILGRYWKMATPPQRLDFLKLLEDRIVVHNVMHFKKFEVNDVQFKILATREIAADDSIVKTKIGDKSGGQQIAMDWRIIRRDGRFWIFDVTVQGMSMGMAHQAEYRSIMSKNNGDMEALLEVLRQ